MKYLVSGEVTISIFTEVEADDIEQAKELAMERDIIRLCHQCASGRSSKEQWTTNGSLDGEPRITEILG